MGGTSEGSEFQRSFEERVIPFGLRQPAAALMQAACCPTRVDSLPDLVLSFQRKSRKGIVILG
jgi:hypothetical protein